MEIAPGKELHFAFVVVYLLALIGVGAVKARKIKSQADFSLAGRGLPTFVLVGTLLATWIGTGSIFSNAEKTYETGLAAFLLPIAGSLGIITLYFLAGRIRRFGQFTSQDILEARFGPAARVLGTITLLISYVIIVSYQYRAGAHVLEYLIDGIDGRLAIVLVALFVIAYTALAGMISVAYTDVANGILMTIGILVAVPLLWNQVGGWDAAVAAVPVDWRNWGRLSSLQLVSALLPPFLLILGDANMYQRFFSARSPESARRAAMFMFLGVVLLESAIILVAFLGRALVDQGQLAEPAKASHIILVIAFDVLPPFVGALMVGTVIAVVVSTADSYLLAPATSVVRDVYQRFLEPDAGERKVVLIGRLVVCALGLIALGLAFTSDRFFDVAILAYSFYGVGITPVLLAAFFWPRATRQGAVAAMVTSILSICAWEFAQVHHAGFADWVGATGIESSIPALALSFLVLVGVSLATPPPDAAHTGVI